MAVVGRIKIGPLMIDHEGPTIPSEVFEAVRSAIEYARR
jgi:hypothetical protein